MARFRKIKNNSNLAFFPPLRDPRVPLAESVNRQVVQSCHEKVKLARLKIFEDAPKIGETLCRTL